MSNLGKKIGIVTFHKAPSYGAVLQSYALLQTVKKICPNATAGLIDLYPERFSKHNINDNYRVFYNFSKTFLPVLTLERPTLPECLAEVVEKNQPVTDLLAGSDQIWNPHILKDTVKDYFMYGDLGNVNKFSFAASFGVNELNPDPDTKKIICAALSSYKRISVRESSGIELCKNFGRSDAVNVLDPTLAADPAIYSNFIQPDFCKNKVVGFFLAKAKYQAKILKKISRVLKSSPLFLGSKTPFLSFIAANPNPAVEEFVSAIHNADCIATDSFHGVCFSIIFRKQFVVLPSHRKDRFVRIAELLQMLNLEKQIIYDHSSKQAIQATISPIDYNQVYDILNSKRKFSLAYLQECFAE